MFLTKIKKSALIKNILLFLAILGPGIITGSVDNDAGGITTYSVVGASYGYNLIWSLIPCFIVLVVVQEMNARMGLVTGKGLADLIRESAGVKLTFVIFAFLLVGDIFNTASEFAGIAGASAIIDGNNFKFIVVPIVAVAIWFLVVKGTYKIAEKVFLVFSVALLSYIIAALMNPHISWSEIGHAIVHPQMKLNFGTIATVVGLVGTTIAPWMQFYMQSSVIDKGLVVKDYKYTVIDIVVGCVATIGVAFFIIIACASTLNVQGITIGTAADAAKALSSIAGEEVASILFTFGMMVASIFASVILPVAVSFYVCEAFGFEAGLDKTWKEAPVFYWLYTIIIAIGAGLILLVPNGSLIQLTLWTQRINGIMLPVVLLLMMIIINKKEVMGEHVNKPIQNVIGWTTISILVVLSLFMLVSSVFKT
jgi:Mn2+/Fe2+ NRAMP family transporter